MPPVEDGNGSTPLESALPPPPWRAIAPGSALSMPPWCKEPVDVAAMAHQWPQVLEAVAKRSKVAWVMLSNGEPAAVEATALTLRFAIPKLRDVFPGSRSEAVLVEALNEVFGPEWTIAVESVTPTSATGSETAGRAPEAPAPTSAPEFRIVQLKSRKRHATSDGISTACGTLIPTSAALTRATPEWYLHINCYNCAHRLWPQNGPKGYIQPQNGSDFPPRKACPHGGVRQNCLTCTPEPTRLVSWPCPNGCSDPKDHDARRSYPACFVRPPHRAPGDGERCVEGCESTEIALGSANPGLFLDLADSASATCYHCGEPVCVGCGRTAVDEILELCGACGEA